MKPSTITVAQSNAFVTSFELSPTDSGLLDGLRFAVKDTIDVAGFKTGCCNPTWRDSHPDAVVHAICVEQLLRAGACCVGNGYRRLYPCAREQLWDLGLPAFA